METKSEHYLSKLHQELIGIMDDVDKACKKLNLKYYLVGGTLLGAIRHKGFIPWDDDLDIAMPRPDFDKFMQMAEKYLPTYMKIMWVTTNENHPFLFAKVVDCRTLFQQRSRYNDGIFIDVFPLDYSPAFSPSLNVRKKMAVYLCRIIRIKNTKNVRLKTFKYFVMSKILSNKFAQKAILHLLTTAQNNGKTHLANFGSQYNLSKQTLPVDWYGGGIPVQFEGRTYMAPNDYCQVLNSIYGANYMQIPPEAKRRCHYPVKVKFSDGEIMEFDVPKHIVTIEEQQK